VVPVYAGYEEHEVRRALKRKEEPSYQGTFTSARRYVLQAFATTESPMIKQRVAKFMVSADCPQCHGKRLRKESLSVKFAGLDIAGISHLPLKELANLVEPYTNGSSMKQYAEHPEKGLVAERIAQDLKARLTVMLDLGLGYLSLERSTPTLSPGELQRLRLATQVRSNLFGVVYVLDEPSAGLHPADTEALLRALDTLKTSGNSLFVVEHELDVIRHADWIVDVGPDAGDRGGRILYSGPPAGLCAVKESHTRKYLFGMFDHRPRSPRSAKDWLKLAAISRNNLRALDVAFPKSVMTTVTGVSGSGKSSLVSQVLVELVASHFGQSIEDEDNEDGGLARAKPQPTGGHIAAGLEGLRRLVRVDQKPIGRTPRSNLATYTGLFDTVRRLFAATKEAKARRYDPGRFYFNVKKGRCENCQGEGFVMVELLFLPSVYSPCPVCHGARYNAKTLEIKYRDKSISDVLGMTVNEALGFFSDESHLNRALTVLKDVGLGYLRLGQPATELSGGEAQRIKLATELQRLSRGDSLYVLDEPTTGLHPADVERLIQQLDTLVEAGNTVILVEHDMHVIASSDWVIDMGPGAGDEGGTIIAAGTPQQIAQNKVSRTAPYLKRFLEGQ
jgi:excinuclease ABC subunit A